MGGVLLRGGRCCLVGREEGEKSVWMGKKVRGLVPDCANDSQPLTKSTLLAPSQTSLNPSFDASQEKITPTGSLSAVLFGMYQLYHCQKTMCQSLLQGTRNVN